MQRKRVIFIADSLDNAHKFQQILSGMDADVAAGSSAQMGRLVSQYPQFDVMVYEARGAAFDNMGQLETLLSRDCTASVLFIVDELRLAEFHPPVRLHSDFVVHGAGSAECTTRIRKLLWPGNESSSSDYIAVDGMVVNLATYQVTVGGEPLDLTYLEYALLSFLITHPGRTYSRDALLSRVWGFDYYGGSRTVDVHVRRVRAKLGPELAQHLETVRGVGYLWN